jgi:hypothetical protein
MNKKMKQAINNSLNTLGIVSLLLLTGSVILLLGQVTYTAAFTAQLGVASAASWSFFKELFYC